MRPARRPGLALLDLLIALALLVLIAGGLSGAMGLSVRLYERTEALAAPMDRIAARVAARRWIMRAAPPSPELRRPPFEGTPRLMRFLTSDPSIFPGENGAVVTITLEGDVLAYELTSSEGGSNADVFAGTLLDGASDLRFGYYDAERQRWLNDWNDRSRLPSLVRIAPVVEDSRWPRLTVQPRLN